MNRHTPLCPTCHQVMPRELRDPRQLTARELEICAMLADGATSPKIAIALSIEIGTVKNHVHSVIQKLGVDNRKQAGIWYANRYKAE